MSLDLLQVLTLIIINSISVFLLIVISSNSLKYELNKWFVIMTLCLIGWVNFSYLGFSSKDISLAVLFYKLNMASVSAFFFASYIFYIEKYLNITINYLKIGLLIGCTLFIALSLFTDTIIQGISQQPWGNEILFGSVNPFFNIYVIGSTGIFIYFLVSRYLILTKRDRRVVIYFIIGAFALIIFNLIFNVFVPFLLKTAKYQTLGDFSSIIFLILTAIAILRYRFLGAKVALTALLISIIAMFLLIDIFLFSNTLIEVIVKLIMLVFFIIISVLLVASVLTEIKQREILEKTNIALSRSRRRFQDLAQEQKDIIDVMGHEVRTPLTAIIQEINLHKMLSLPKKKEFLAHTLPQPEKDSIATLFFDTIETIDKASSQAAHLVNDMLETARLDKKRFELNYSQFNILEVIKDSVVQAQRRYAQTRCIITFKNKSKQSNIVEADKTRIKESIDALLDNAVKYRDQTKESCYVRVTLWVTKTSFIIKIRDNGIGINPDDINKLGKKFMRLHAHNKNSILKRPGGTGLGLFVVKGIIKHHMGKLIIKSSGEGKGSSFSMEIPIKNPKT